MSRGEWGMRRFADLSDVDVSAPVCAPKGGVPHKFSACPRGCDTRGGGDVAFASLRGAHVVVFFTA